MSSGRDDGAFEVLYSEEIDAQPCFYSQADDQTLIMPDTVCICCGRREYIPEGYMICWQCRKYGQEEW